MRKPIWVGIVAIAIAIVTATHYYRSDVAAEAPPLVSAKVLRGSVVSTVEATGTLEAVTTVQVGSQVSGAIKALHADFNSEVHKGQIIAELDPSLFETQVEQAKATVLRLQAEADRARVQASDADLKLRRARELFAKQLVPASDLETADSTARAAESAVKSADAQIVQARASLNQAQVNLSNTVIRAPIDGVVISRNVDVGQTVAASMQAPTLFVIARDLTEMRVNASIDESDIGVIHPKQPVRFRVDAYPNDTFSGVVSQVRLQPMVSQNVVSYITVIDVPNPSLKLKPGMTASVTVETARADDALYVPNAALRFRPSAEVFAALGQTPPTPAPDASANESPPPRNGDRGAGAAPDQRAAVWALDQGTLRRVPVRTGISDGTHTAIVAGDLAPGSVVVTGMPAVAAPSAAAAAGSPLLPFTGRGRGPR
jgi:HlyD family secretion protein